MKISEKEFYKILEDEENDVRNFASFLNYRKEDFRGDNIVVDILKYGELSLEELLCFLPISNDHRKNNKSFVLVNDTINIDDVPEELAIVPSLQEAADFVQMEEIERDLGPLDAF